MLKKNALSNCVVRPDNGIAYVTGQCCNDCIIALWQEGITSVYMQNSHGTKLFDEKNEERFNKFITMSGMNITYVNADLSWITNIKV